MLHFRKVFELSLPCVYLYYLFNNFLVHSHITSTVHFLGTVILPKHSIKKRVHSLEKRSPANRERRFIYGRDMDARLQELGDKPPVKNDWLHKLWVKEGMIGRGGERKSSG